MTLLVQTCVTQLAAGGGTPEKRQAGMTLVNTAATALCAHGAAAAAADLIGWLVGRSSDTFFFADPFADAAASAAWISPADQFWWTDNAVDAALNFVSKHSAVAHLRLRAFAGLSLAALSPDMQRRVLLHQPPVVSHEALVRYACSLLGVCFVEQLCSAVRC